MKNPWKTKAAKRKSWSVNAVQKKAALRIARGEADMTADPDEFRRGRSEMGETQQEKSCQLENNTHH